MSWADKRARILRGDPRDAPEELPHRPLTVSELLAVREIRASHGDGAIPVTAWELVEKHWQHVTRNVRVLSPNQAEAVRDLPEILWTTAIETRRGDPGWLIVTDPITGEEHEIPSHEAHSAWVRDGELEE